MAALEWRTSGVKFTVNYKEKLIFSLHTCWKWKYWSVLINNYFRIIIKIILHSAADIRVGKSQSLWRRHLQSFERFEWVKVKDIHHSWVMHYTRCSIQSSASLGYGPHPGGTNPEIENRRWIYHILFDRRDTQRAYNLEVPEAGRMKDEGRTMPKRTPAKFERASL